MSESWHILSHLTCVRLSAEARDCTTRNLVQSLSLKQRTCVDRLGEMSAELIGPLTAAVCDPGADKAGTGAEDTLQGG